MTDIISTIDSATGCHQCGNPLGSSPSSDFCSEFCQRVWQANRVGAAAVAPESIPHYSAGGVIWGSANARPGEEYRAHYEIRADGSLVDNTPFIRERQRNANSTLRSFLGGEEVWWP